jgi:hypothetical protein
MIKNVDDLYALLHEDYTKIVKWPKSITWPTTKELPMLQPHDFVSSDGLTWTHRDQRVVGEAKEYLPEGSLVSLYWDPERNIWIASRSNTRSDQDKDTT